MYCMYAGVDIIFKKAKVEIKKLLLQFYTHSNMIIIFVFMYTH